MKLITTNSKKKLLNNYFNVKKSITKCVKAQKKKYSNVQLVNFKISSMQIIKVLNLDVIP